MTKLQDYSIESKSLKENSPLEGNLNRREAIRQKCYQCSTYNWNEVAHCEVRDCPLFAFRAKRGHQDPKERNKAIKAECMSCMNHQPYLISNCDEYCPLHDFRGYMIPENYALNRKFSLESTTCEVSNDLSFKSDSKIPQEKLKSQISTQVR